MSEIRQHIDWKAVAERFLEFTEERSRVISDRDEIAALVDELRQDCNQLQKERDEAQAAIAAAEFDRDWFRAQRDDWKRDAELSAAQADAAYVERDKANREAARHSQEAEVTHSKLALLRAGQDRWEADDFPCCSYGAAPTDDADDDTRTPHRP